MPMSQGLTGLVTYTGTDPAKVQQLIDLIPNPDVAPAAQGARGYLDEMSPMCAAQLRLELTILKAATT